MPEDIEKIKHLIGHNFSNKQLLRKALTHRSYAAENNLKYDNQRLEFLGDAVLEIILSEYLFARYKNAPEGKLTKMRAAMVNQSSLAQLARKCDLGKFLLVGKGELECGGCERDSTLSDLFEAIIGALFLDAGLEVTKEFTLKLIQSEFPNPEKMLISLNPKGALQEYSQKKWGETPQYTLKNVSGPDHDPIFEVSVSVDDFVTTGIAPSRKMAESNAAKQAILEISQTDPDF